MMESAATATLFYDPSACNGNRGQRTMLSMDDNWKRRPFFSSPNDLFDDDYYDQQLPEKKRRLTPEQVHLLEKSFEAENKLEPDKKTQLAKKLGLQPRQVNVWFQNRRARWKTKQLERDYDLLKASYDSLLTNYETVAKENEKLKSEVVSLTKKLQAKEAPMSGQHSHLAPLDTSNSSAHHQLNMKVEDHLSSGSAGSAVVDEDSPHLVDSGDSCFPESYVGYKIPTDGLQSEDDRSDDDQSYFSLVYATAELQQYEGEEEPMGWWVWSQEAL